MHFANAGRVLVVGSANEDIALSVDILPGPGATVLAHSIIVGPGGKGANQAVASARAGVETHFVGCFGDDARGTLLRARLDHEGIDTSASVVALGESSGLAVITVDRGANNSITVLAGANALLPIADVERAIGRLSGRDIVLLQCEIPPACVDAAIAVAHTVGARVVLNLAPFRVHGFARLSANDLVVVNEPEARQLLALTGISAEIDAPAMELAPRVASAFNMGCVVTLGERGSVLSRPGDDKPHIVPAIPASHVVDTTGAGDAYVGALAARLAAGDGVPEAMRLATKAASISVTRRGAQDSYPRTEELHETPTGSQLAS